MSLRKPRRILAATLLVGGSMGAFACSKFSSTDAPVRVAEAGQAAAVTVDAGGVDAGGPDANTCETVTFDLGASELGAGWTRTVREEGGAIEAVDGGVHAYDAPARGVAYFEYRIVHRESLTRVTLRVQYANVLASADDAWAAAAFFARNDDQFAGTIQVVRTPEHAAKVTLNPPDGGALVTVVAAASGSFPDRKIFDLSLTAEGAWRDGPVVSLASNGYVANDSTSPKLPPYPDNGDAVAQSVDVGVGVLSAPPNSASVEIQAVELEICR